MKGKPGSSERTKFTKFISDSRTETYGIMLKKSVTCRDLKKYCILSKMSVFLR